MTRPQWVPNSGPTSVRGVPAMTSRELWSPRAWQLLNPSAVEVGSTRHTSTRDCMSYRSQFSSEVDGDLKFINPDVSVFHIFLQDLSTASSSSYPPVDKVSQYNYEELHRTDCSLCRWRTMCSRRRSKHRDGPGCLHVATRSSLGCSI